MKKKELQAQVDELRRQNSELVQQLIELAQRPREVQFFGPTVPHLPEYRPWETIISHTTTDSTAYAVQN